MKTGDKQVGFPSVLYKNTKTNIEALTGVEEGAVAYATDTDELGTYDGSAWTWGSGGGGGAVDSVNGQTGVVVLDAGDIGTTPAGGLSSTDVQAALNELDTEKATGSDLIAHITDTTDAHDASAISVADAGDWFTATDVEGVTQELGARPQAPNLTRYNFDTATTAADPGAGDIRFNSATFASITNMYISQTSALGGDIARILEASGDGDVWYLQDADDATKWIRLEQTAAGTDNGAWWTIPVSHIGHAGTLFANTTELVVVLNMSPATAVPSTEDIQDIIGAMVSGNTETGIAATYDDTNGKLDFDAQTAGDARYAPIAKGVTNGDTHDHSGGDGNQIAHSSLSGLGTGQHVPTDFIHGLQLTWVSGTALDIEKGIAVCENGDIVTVSTKISLTGLSFSASTWYHVYLYLSSGTPTAELSTTQAVVYNGTARSKSGATGRRYLGSVLSDGAGTPAMRSFVHTWNSGLIMWSGDNDLDASPFRVLNGGTSTSPTAVALTAVIPATARLAYVRLINLANAVVFFGPTSNVNGPALNAGNTAAQTAFSFIPMDSSQQYYYDYNVAPTGGAYIDVYGYHFDR